MGAHDFVQHGKFCKARTSQCVCGMVEDFNYRNLATVTLTLNRETTRENP
jgi:hypothetical protein